MDLQKQKQILLQQRSEAVDLLETTRGTNEGEQEHDETPVDSDIPTHDADVATVLFERERDEAFIGDYKSLIQQIDLAIARIEDGTYGICTECGKPISEERLEAQPYATLCIDDQELLQDI